MYSSYKPTTIIIPISKELSMVIDVGVFPSGRQHFYKVRSQNVRSQNVIKSRVSHVYFSDKKLAKLEALRRLDADVSSAVLIETWAEFQDGRFYCIKIVTRSADDANSDDSDIALSKEEVPIPNSYAKVYELRCTAAGYLRAYHDNASRMAFKFNMYGDIEQVNWAWALSNEDEFTKCFLLVENNDTISKTQATKELCAFTRAAYPELDYIVHRINNIEFTNMWGRVKARQCDNQ